MSKILIAYNSAAISEENSKRIIESLYSQQKKNDDRFVREHIDSSKREVFGNLQIVYSRKNNQKIRMYYHKDGIFINICGIIDNEKHLCRESKCNRIEELLVKSYKKSKSQLEKILSGTSGQYAVFIYDKKKDEVVIANDKLGLYSAFIYEAGETLVYATEVEAILRLGHVKREMNYDAIADYLALGIVQKNQTFIKTVDNLPPATILYKSGKKASSREKYFTFKFEGKNYQRQEYLELAHAKLKAAVLDLFDGYSSNLAVCLTGGFDTRTLNSVLVDAGRRQRILFTRTPTARVRTDIDHQALAADEKIGRQFADHYDLPYYAEGDAGKGERNISKDESFTLLHGLFGGELFGGEVYNFPRTLYASNIPSMSRMSVFSDRFVSLLSRDPIEEYYNNIEAIESDEKDKRVYVYKAQLASTSYFNNLEDYGNPCWQRPRLFFNEPYNILYPFTNVDFLSVVFRIPYSELREHGFYRDLLATYYPEYCRFGFLHGKKRLYKFDPKKNPKIYLYRKVEVYLRDGVNGTEGENVKKSPKVVHELNEFLGNPVAAKHIDDISFMSDKNENRLFVYRLNQLKKWFNRYYFNKLIS